MSDFYVEDIAKANVLVVKSAIRNGEIFNIASGKPTSINELFAAISRVLKVEAQN